MKVKTSRFWYRGESRMDITAKTNDEMGKLFAPPWGLVMEYKNKKIDEYEYRRRYSKLLKDRWDEKGYLFAELLEREEVTFVCYCPAGAFCHRVLAAEFLIGKGAVYIGEIPI